MTLRKSVTDLLQFESTLESDRIIKLSAKEQKPGRIRVFDRELANRLCLGQDLPNFIRQTLQGLYRINPLGAGEMANAAKQESQQRQTSNLRGKRFGGRHSNLRPSVHIHATVT